MREVPRCSHRQIHNNTTQYSSHENSKTSFPPPHTQGARQPHNQPTTMPPLTILITGANRGIGFSTLNSLALHSPQNTYLLGARTLPSGTEALDTLHTLGIPPTTQIHPIILDISKDSSILSAVSEIRSQFQKLDILINNAGISIAPKSSTPSSSHPDMPQPTTPT